MAVALGQLRCPVALPVTRTRHTEGLAAGFGGQLDRNKITGKGWHIYTLTPFSASFQLYLHVIISVGALHKPRQATVARKKTLLSQL